MFTLENGTFDDMANIESPSIQYCSGLFYLYAYFISPYKHDKYFMGKYSKLFFPINSLHFLLFPAIDSICFAFFWRFDTLPPPPLSSNFQRVLPKPRYKVEMVHMTSMRWWTRASVRSDWEDIFAIGPYSAFFNDFEIFNGPFLIILHGLRWAIF